MAATKRVSAAQAATAKCQKQESVLEQGAVEGNDGISVKRRMVQLGDQGGRGGGGGSLAILYLWVLFEYSHS